MANTWVHPQVLVGTLLFILLTLGEHLGSSEGAGMVLVLHLFSFRFLSCALYFLPFFFPSFLLPLSSCLFLVSQDCPFLRVSSFCLSFFFASSVLVSVSCVSGLSFPDSFFFFSFLLFCFLCPCVCFLCLRIVLS